MTTAAAPPSFAEVPAVVARELRDGRRRVAVVFLDAFGWTFAERHAQHPLLAKLARDGVLAPMASQFPSTTVAHVTTMHTGLPVEAHGLYEWQIYEPSVDRVIRPFVDKDLADVDVRLLLPEGPSFHHRLATLGVPSRIWHPFPASKYDDVALRGTTRAQFGELADGLGAVTEALADADRLYTYLYWDRIDATGHVFGPSSPEFDDIALRSLDAVYAAFFGPQAPRLENTTLILTADHGQIDVSPQTILDVDQLVPDLADRLTAAPAGSPRDLFLHVAPDDVDRTIADLSSALGSRATVHASRDLFPIAGPRLLARLAPICILPSGNHTTWLATHYGHSQTFLGHHGGRTPEEATTTFGAIELG
ncbi:alkaline phosphatase family protein [Baekduia sp. Peel2402]|uniref:alkaline phosphatase family protein n=1 Tax=Baekduia sp. Peel2402 TaxID=3458296 RepID=UPI00403E6CBA